MSQMQAHQPSHTAQRVASRRAAHQLFDRPLVFDDPLALRIIGRAEANTLREESGRKEHGALARYLRAFLVARSRVAEDALAALVADGVTQYVVLGAGLDTFAYRNPYPRLKVFEVDHPATQAWKRQRLADEGFAATGALTFVPVDFEQQDLAEELARAGFETAAGAFFSWLGVTPYLAEPAILSTLRYAAGVTHTGGGIVFDYGVPPASLTLLERAAFEVMAARVRAAGEPWQTFFEPTALAALLRTAGFAHVEDLSGADLNRRYFTGRDDGLKVGTLGHIACAFGGKIRSS